MAEGIKPSLTRTLFNMAKAYDDVIDFTLGDPDVPTHQKIKDAGCKAIQDSKTRYSQNAGLLELRNVISDYYIRKEGTNGKIQNNYEDTGFKHKHFSNYIKINYLIGS